MKEEMVNKVVEAILEKTFFDDWYFYLILFSVSLIGALIGAILKGYGSEKGKYAAIESSLDTIKKQVAETTQTAEKIRQDIEYNIWRKKDREMIKRQKLEEYFLLIFISREAFCAEMENKLLRQNNKFDEYAYYKAELIQTLYFPELAEVHNLFRKAVAKYKAWLSEGMAGIVEQMKNGDRNATATSEHLNKWSEIINQFNNPIEEIRDKVEELAKQINT